MMAAVGRSARVVIPHSPTMLPDVATIARTSLATFAQPTLFITDDGEPLERHVYDRCGKPQNQRRDGVGG